MVEALHMDETVMIPDNYSNFNQYGNEPPPLTKRMRTSLNREPQNNQIVDLLKTVIQDQKEQRMQIRRIEALLRRQEPNFGQDEWEMMIGRFI